MLVDSIEEDTMIVDDADKAAEITQTRRWVEQMVIGLNLCPFAKAVAVKGQVRYALSSAVNVEQLLGDLVAELNHLALVNPNETDTTLLIHPQVMTDFLDYNDFLELADAAVLEMGLEGEIQIASFHPHYQFADSEPEDVANYTNRSPYPTLHLLREASVDKAVAAFDGSDEIYLRNIETLEKLGLEAVRARCSGS
jgi:uncharacterized protein